MAKRYGNRWELIDTLPVRSGQADLFFVRDLSGEFDERCVLKRIRNPKRDERFRAEVDAGTRLRHKNIMRVIDHSRLDRMDDNADMYIVMPFAPAGSLEKRANIYADSIDSTMKVATALARALGHAHSASPRVIHRDVKPANILFFGDDHDAVLADFGICLIEDRVRATQSGEVVGPWEFMAPELAGGGQLDVSPAADLYSLGKVIYFMISGGRILPREAHRQNDYDRSGRGGAYQLLWALLDDLLCPVERRLRSAAEAIMRLERIDNWSRRSVVSVSAATIASFDEIISRDRRNYSVQQENQEIRQRREAQFRGFAESLKEWVSQELHAQADQIHRPGELEASSGSEQPPQGLAKDWGKNYFGYGQLLRPIWSADLKLTQVKPFVKEHRLRFIFSQSLTARIHVGEATPAEIDQPHLGILIPIYFRTADWCGFLSYREDIIRSAPPVIHQAGGNAPAQLVRRTFIGGAATEYLGTHLDAWPGDVNKYSQLIMKSIDIFAKYIALGANVLGQ